MSALLPIIITLSLITASLCLVVATVMQGDLSAETEMPPASRAALMMLLFILMGRRGYFSNGGVFNQDCANYSRSVL